MATAATQPRDPLASALSKSGVRTLPLIGLAYLVAYMDRVNISFAATRMNADLGFSATVYGMGGGLFFLSYALFEIPSNVLMLRTGPRVWIARILITWGLLSAAMMFVTSPLSFYALRFAIGAAEAGFFPAAVFYVSSWFPRRQRGRAISLFYLFGPMASAVMGWLSAFLLTLDGAHDLAGWQWLFLVEGLPAVLLGIVLLLRLPDHPATAPFLAANEREALLGALDADFKAAGEPSHDLGAVLREPMVQWMSVIGILSIGSFYAFTLSAPQILIEKAEITTASAGNLVSVGGLIGVATMYFAGWNTDRVGNRFSTLLPAIAVEACCLLVMAISPSPLAVLCAYLGFAASWPIVTVCQVSIWGDTLRDRQLAIGAAAINTASQIGAFVSPIIFGAARDATGGYAAGLLALPLMLVAVIALTIGLRHRLAERDRAMAIVI